MILITGASDNHFKTLNQFIKQFLNFYLLDSTNKNANYSVTLIVYNLGLSLDNWNYLLETYNYSNIIYKIFDYSIYPEYVNINMNAGEYAWKPIIISDISFEYKNEIIIWMDSGNIINEKLDKLCDYVNINGIYSFISEGTVSKWTHPETIKFFECQYMLNYECKNASCLGFNTKFKWINDLIYDFKTCALIKECIAPEGSNRNNHRQDQSVFTILFYRYKEIYNFSDDIDNYLCYSIHNDID